MLSYEDCQCSRGLSGLLDALSSMSKSNLIQGLTGLLFCQDFRGFGSHRCHFSVE